jgi:hypothetical protein
MQRFWIFLTITAFAPAVLIAQQRDEFGAASFIAPVGWSNDRRPTLQTFARIRGQHRCLLLISAPERARATLDASFDAVWTAVFNPNTYRRADRPRAEEGVTPAGTRHAAGGGEVEDRAGNRLVARLHVFPLGPDIQSIVLVGSSAAAIDDCRDDWNVFFASLRFNGAAPTRATASPAAPAVTPSPAERPVNRVEPGDRTPTQFENLSFVAPNGWRVQRDPGGVRLSPAEARGMEALEVLLLPGRRAAGSLSSDFDAAWQDVRSLLAAAPMLTVNRTPYDLDQPARSLRGTNYLYGTGGMRRADGTYTVQLYVFRAGDRAERAAVVSRDFRDNAVMVTTANNPVYSRAIRELLFTMKFANQPDGPVVLGGLKPGGIVGVWAGLSMSTGRIQTNFAVFFDNGLAYFGPKFPVRGLLDIDPVVEQPAHLRYWGTYVLTGEAGTLTMPYGTIPLRRIGAALELTTNRTAHRFVKLTMPERPLDGTWCLSGGQCLRLTADGRFDDAGVVRAVEHSTYAFPSTPAGGQGRYSLRDHTLVLVYDSGPEVRVGFAGLVPDQVTTSPRDLRLGFEADLLVRR